MADFVGAAFVMIRRSVFLAYQEAYPRSRYAKAGSFPEAYTENLYDYFPIGVANGWMLSEDVSFCHRVRALGIDVWVDPTVRLGHHGRAVWEGALADAMAIQGDGPDRPHTFWH